MGNRIWLGHIVRRVELVGEGWGGDGKSAAKLPNGVPARSLARLQPSPRYRRRYMSQRSATWLPAVLQDKFGRASRNSAAMARGLSLRALQCGITYVQGGALASCRAQKSLRECCQSPRFAIAHNVYQLGGYRSTSLCCSSGFVQPPITPLRTSSVYDAACRPVWYEG